MKKSYDFSKARRGAVIPAGAGKTRITIRIDDDVLEWFRKQVDEVGGGSYQAMMNQGLREYMGGEIEPLEETFRRVLLEVIPNAKPNRNVKSAKKHSVRRKAASR